jgi:hypothetical protein
MNVHEHPIGVDISDLQVQGLLKSQAQRVDGPEVGREPWSVRGVDESSDLGDRQHVGECFGPGNPELLERLPIAWLGVGIEELDAAHGDLQRAGGELLFVLKVEDVLANPALGKLVGRRVEMCGQLPHGAEVGPLSAVAQAGELKIFRHAST